MYISFKNCMKLDGQSLASIIEGARCLMMQAANGIALQRTLTEDIFYLSRKSFEVCFPESRVPYWFTCGTKEAESVTIELLPSSQLLGFVFCVVLDRIFGREEFEADVLCKLYWEDSTLLVGSSLPTMGIREKMNSDHVYMWYSPWDCENILKRIERRADDQCVADLKVFFEFSVQTFKFVPNQKGFGIKECGVYPMYVSKCQELNWQMKLKSKFDWNNKRPRDFEEQDLLPQFKKLQLGDLGTQTNKPNNVDDELEALLNTINIT